MYLALPVPCTTVIVARHYGRSLWGETAKISTKLPDSEYRDYFLKVGGSLSTFRPKEAYINRLEHLAK